ncbi:phage tail tube protein [Pseudomonas sp. UMAB-08]|uniref:phage tail tube protein n=1 Tax=Pseudomonas sp. UMAB-08 TaxID=1365375 RepID=UPI001C55E389|nr:phage tail tube protein [Pseudomonas sp. UMAB-08]
MGINTGANTRISIGVRLAAKLPATSAAAITLLSALTYIEIGEMESIGDYGDTINDVTFSALASGRATHLKGLADAGSVELSIGFDAGDAGQLALVAAFQDRSQYDYPIKVEYVDGLVDYFAAKVMSNKKTGISVEGVVKRTVTLGINSEIYEVPVAP